MFAQSSYYHVNSIVKYPWKQCTQCIRLLSSQVLEHSVANEGPWNLYTEKVANKSLSQDTHQEQVVQHLQKVYQEVTTFNRPTIQSPQNALFRFFKKKEPEKIIAPKGLYIYGSVGGGKTMLMDLFYETVPVSKKLKPFIFIFHLKIVRFF